MDIRKVGLDNNVFTVNLYRIEKHKINSIVYSEDRKNITLEADKNIIDFYYNEHDDVFNIDSLQGKRIAFTYEEALLKQQQLRQDRVNALYYGIKNAEEEYNRTAELWGLTFNGTKGE